jgi:hypothetical protein
MLTAGQRIVEIWSGGTLFPSYGLIAAMTAMMVVSGFWHPISNLMLALNRQQRYSYIYLGAVVVAVALAYPLSLGLGEVGAACSLLLVDLFMLQFIGRLVWRAFFGSASNPTDEQIPMLPPMHR